MRASESQDVLILRYNIVSDNNRVKYVGEGLCTIESNEQNIRFNINM